MRARGTGPHILIVDDEPAATEALRELLEDEGYVVATAAAGAEALERLGNDEPQVLLTDLCLPDIDGLELARKARERAHCAVLVMTGSERIRSDDSGFEHIMKPIDIDELLARIGRLAKPA
jgi:DNA-binding response OmpR family regulator